jgi:hypothetical protein
MPTTASSNNPHVRLTRETHDKLRLISFVERKSQGAVIEEMATARLVELGNPQVVVPPRQKAATAAPEPTKSKKLANKKAEAISRRRTALGPPAPSRTRARK